MDEDGWEALPGSRRPTQLPVWAGFTAMFYELPITLLLFPFALLFAGAADAANRSGGVEVDVALTRLRRGRQEISASDVEKARLLRDPDDYEEIHLQLEAPRFAFRVPLRNEHGVLISSRAREMLLELLPHTSIEMPESHYDPKGKFAKYNFPSHITKDEAIALMQKPPKHGDPLPIPG